MQRLTLVAKNADSSGFCKDSVDTVIYENLLMWTPLLACRAHGSELTVDALLKERFFTIGENISASFRPL